MSTENAAADVAASAGTSAPVANAIVPAVASVAPVIPPAPPVNAAAPAVNPPADPTKDPAWLPQRLEQARRALLAELGVDDVGNAKASLAAYKAHQDAQKTELQRAQEQIAALTPVAKERDAYKAIVEAKAIERLNALPADRQAIVKSIAGDDPIRIGSTLDMLIPTWATGPSAPSAPAAAQPPVAPPPAAPATVAPIGTPPKPTGAKTKYDEWQEHANRGNHLAAGLFYQANKTAIEQSRPAS